MRAARTALLGGLAIIAWSASSALGDARPTIRVGGLYGSGECSSVVAPHCTGPVSVSALSRTAAGVSLTALPCLAPTLVTLRARVRRGRQVWLGPIRRTLGARAAGRVIAVSLRLRLTSSGRLRGTLRLTGVRPRCRAGLHRVELRYAGRYRENLP